jgi:hypothetical protein
MKTKKPVLIHVGKHFINPNNVSAIRAVKVSDRDEIVNLYVIDFISNPNPEYTCWIEKKDIGILLDQFEIIEKD